MNRRLSKYSVTAVALAMAASALLPAPSARALSQTTIPLVVSVPSVWQDTLTDDVVAEFEAQHPGVDVILTFSDSAFFGFGPVSADISAHLDSTEELVTSADVVYVDPSTLTEADTQAGYFLDLSPLALSDPALNVNDFVPAAWQSFQWDNGLWALPLSVDVILLTYDPVTFDQAGLAYPNERWTIDDFANAARRLAQYDADGNVTTPGFSTLSGGNNQNVFLRTLAGVGFYESTTTPNAPTFSNPALEYALEVWNELIQEGVVAAQGGGLLEDVPLRVEGINGYAQREFGPDSQSNDTPTRYAALLPGGVAGLSAQGFAVSAGTQYPEVAYALASFLTLRPELASNFFSAAPARYSLVGAQATSSSTGGGQGGGFVVSGGQGEAFFGSVGGGQTIPDAIQPVFDQGLTVALPVSELRYASYLGTALSDMSANGTDARSALQVAEAQAYNDMQTAVARAGTVNLFVTPPAAAPPLAPGKIELTCAVNLGFGGGPGGSQLPNQDDWDQLIATFVANDPQVGAVTLESARGQDDLATLAQQVDCIILPYNAVEGADVSSLLSLDPLIDNDPTFDRNDVIGNTLAQLQQDSKTWALPLAIQPQMLEYDPEKFAQAGVPQPVNGWTVDAFVDALRTLKPYDTDPTPFVANDPSGSYLLMLIAAFGGLPLDYRTDPPTVNFTDPATVDAIRQVLDLAAGGYIDYTALSGSGGFTVSIGEETTYAITTNTLNQFRRFAPPDSPDAMAQDSMLMTPYPQGSQYNVVAYEITTGYISATAQNPEAAYRFLSAVAHSPQLFSGMPARQSLVYDPTIVASQGSEIVAVYQQLDALLRAPNTIVFPTFTAGRGGGGLSLIQDYWLWRAFDNYVLNGADLETELEDAQMITLAYQQCAQSVTVDTTSAGPEQQGQMFQAIAQCATSVDPTFSMGD